jgi:hypothetical protein
LSDWQKQKLNKECVTLCKEAVPGKISHTNVMTYTIDTGDSPPIRSRSYPWSPYIEKEINEEMNRMIFLGVIERSSSSWGHPIVPVRKPSGKMSSVMSNDPYPLPHLPNIGPISKVKLFINGLSVRCVLSDSSGLSFSRED